MERISESILIEQHDWGTFKLASEEIFEGCYNKWSWCELAMDKVIFILHLDKMYAG